MVTGGPSSGKTTLLNALQQKGYKTLPEAARLVIDEGLAQGKTIEQIRANEQHFQEEVFKRKITVENQLNPNDIIFLDRGIQDTWAYFEELGFELTSFMYKPLMKPHYKTVFLLEPLPNFEEDYARTEDRNFTLSITNHLHTAYSRADMTPIRVPVLSINERLQFILNYINKGEA